MGAGALAFRTFTRQGLPEFPQEADVLGCVTGGKVDVFAGPDANNQIVGALYEDQVIPWNRAAFGFTFTPAGAYFFICQTFPLGALQRGLFDEQSLPFATFASAAPL
jgi:hypothetical protein